MSHVHPSVPHVSLNMKNLAKVQLNCAVLAFLQDEGFLAEPWHDMLPWSHSIGSSLQLRGSLDNTARRYSDSTSSVLPTQGRMVTMRSRKEEKENNG